MIFYLYLILAGSMRLLVEFWRVNPVVGASLTEYQWMSLMLIFVGAGLLFYRMETGSQRARTETS
jgi:prolipoprotein diacylglyceryltransferase